MEQFDNMTKPKHYQGKYGMEIRRRWSDGIDAKQQNR